MKNLNAGSEWPAIVCASVAAFGGIVFGYDSGSINGVLAMEGFKSVFGHKKDDFEYEVSPSDIALVVSILSAGTFVGALSVGYSAELLGRKGAILLMSVIFSVGCAIQTASISIPMLAVGRLIAGLGVGAVSGLVPMYQGETAPKKLRGALTSLYQFAVTVGLLLASAVAQGTKKFTGSMSFQIPLGLQCLWALILFVGMLCLPESPRYCIKRGRDEQAAAALAKLRSLPIDSTEVQAEVTEIKASLVLELEAGRSSWLDCFKSNKERNLRRTLIGVCLQMFQQLTGVNFIFYFSTVFFTSIGIKNPFTISLATNIVNVGTTPVSFYTVERFGRRSILIWGAAGMCICQFIIAVVGTVLPNSEVALKSLIAFVCIYIAFFATTWGPAAWVVIGEIFPLNIRAKGIGLSCASNWFWNWFIAFITPYLVSEKEANLKTRVFFIWGTTCFFSYLFAYFFVPETKGLSLEETNAMFQSYTTAAASANFKPQETMTERTGMTNDKPETSRIENVNSGEHSI